MRDPTKKRPGNGQGGAKEESRELIFHPKDSTKHANLQYHLFSLLGQAVYQGKHKVVDSIWELIDEKRGIA